MSNVIRFDVISFDNRTFDALRGSEIVWVSIVRDRLGREAIKKGVPRTALPHIISRKKVCYFFFLLITPAKPARPVPNSSMVAGSGVVDLDLIVSV